MHLRRNLNGIHHDRERKGLIHSAIGRPRAASIHAYRAAVLALEQGATLSHGRDLTQPEELIFTIARNLIRRRAG